ncbi:MAG: transketolase [Pseudomonadota bacterium]
MSTPLEKELVLKARQARKLIALMNTQRQSAHVGTSLSCVEILLALFAGRNLNEKILFSKGHGVMALYAVMHLFGEISEKELQEEYFTNGGRLMGHPSKPHLPEIAWSTGSLGHGLSVASGMALGNRQQKVYVVLSDGECDLGTTWESVLFAGHHRLGNLLMVVDVNGLQCSGKTKEVLDLSPLPEKFKSFHWNVFEHDGHDLMGLLTLIKENSHFWDLPTVILAQTVKGKGVKDLEGEVRSHFYPLNDQQKEELLCGHD